MVVSKLKDTTLASLVNCLAMSWLVSCHAGHFIDVLPLLGLVLMLALLMRLVGGLWSELDSVWSWVGSVDGGSGSLLRQTVCRGLKLMLTCVHQ